MEGAERRTTEGTGEIAKEEEAVTKRSKTLEEVLATSPHMKLEKADPNAPIQIVVGGRPAENPKDDPKGK